MGGGGGGEEKEELKVKLTALLWVEALSFAITDLSSVGIRNFWTSHFDICTLCRRIR